MFLIITCVLELFNECMYNGHTYIYRYTLFYYVIHGIGCIVTTASHLVTLSTVKKRTRERINTHTHTVFVYLRL